MYVNDLIPMDRQKALLQLPKMETITRLIPKIKYKVRCRADSKKFNSYADFAGKTIEEIFGSSLLSSSDQYVVDELQSRYFKMIGGSYLFL